jgi:glycosyltransferase involved in cell wall biosynthesis
MSGARYSIIVPTHGRPGPLATCLRGLSELEAPPDPFEVIVVDDGGPGSLEETVEPYRRTLEIHLLRQAQAGPAAARNAGAAEARGELLVFTDDDVVCEPSWLASLARRAVSSPLAALGGRTVNALPGNPYSRASQRIVDLAYEHYNGGGRPRFFASNNLAVPADGFREIGGFNATFRTSEDREFCDRWVESGRPMTYVPDAVIRHVRPLTLGAFWRQHHAYGRGAFAYHRARARRGRGLTGIEGSFYSHLLREVRSALTHRDLHWVAAIVVWQFANAVGFACEAARSALRGSPRIPTPRRS